MKILCIYHANCADGMAAATIVRMHYGSGLVEFYQGSYGSPPPDVTGRQVLMVDFSYKREVLVQMAAKAQNILILDHHKTVQENLTNLPENVVVNFNMDKSGCGITWETFFGWEKPPMMVRMIEDRDLWRFNLRGSRELHAFLSSQPYRFDDWQSIMEDDCINEMERMIQMGGAILDAMMTNINELIRIGEHEVVINEVKVPALNCPPMWFSEAGAILSKGSPFAALYFEDGETRKWGLRSNAEGLDVGKIAESHGGGGHRHAAGFIEPRLSGVGQ
jgi:uncharacterized protein